MSAAVFAVALATASAGQVAECPAAFAALDETGATSSPAVIACIEGRMSQAVYERTESCIGRFKGSVALRESLASVPGYTHLDDAAVIASERGLLTDFAKMHADPPDGVDTAAGRAAFEQGGAAAKAAMSAEPTQRYARWIETNRLTPQCMQALRYRIGMLTVEQGRLAER